MTIAFIWILMLVVSILFGSAAGRADLIGTAAFEGAAAAVNLCISMTGTICLWSGVMEAMKRSGLSEGLSRLLQKPLRLLFPDAMRDREIARAISENVSANMLGLGNAATPPGVRACELMSRRRGIHRREASDELCRFVVLNTASIQFLPTTVAGLRAAAGAESPFDILPAVLLTSVAALCAGIVAERLLSRVTRP